MAVLDTVAGSYNPALRSAIDAIVAECGIQDAYRASLALVVAWEIRMHRDLPEADPLRSGRLAGLHHAHQRVRQLLGDEPPVR